MPIPKPNLDDRRFSDLVEEMQALIPRYAPEWTDHNVSDPGIMLLELFAWLTEALIYRLNRIPEASVARMVELLGTPFKPAQPTTVSLHVSAEGLDDGLLLPKGTPLQTEPDQGNEAVPFETADDLKLTPSEPSGTVQARQTVLIQDEQLGASDGQPYQAHCLTRPFPAGDEEGKILSCLVTVGGKPWAYKAGFLDLKGHHFTVDPRLGAVCFGDGERGRIPAKGAQIVATYRVTDGVAHNVPEGTTLTIDKRSKLLPPGVKKALDSGVSFTIRCAKDASGGTKPTRLPEARDLVREDFRTHWRSVTREDFAQIALAEPKLNLARAMCVPEMDLSAPDPFTARPGHVSVIVVPWSFLDRPEPSEQCRKHTWDHLDTRRVVTCQHHVVGPAYTEVKIEAEVMRTARSQGENVRRAIKKNLRAFLHPLTGGPDPGRKGWPFGRDIYASEVYQVIENTEGVDHVESLNLRARKKDGDWGDSTDQVVVPLHSLVYWSYQAGDVEVRIVH